MGRFNPYQAREPPATMPARKPSAFSLTEVTVRSDPACTERNPFPYTGDLRAIQTEFRARGIKG